jgi:hypothetical protein
MHEAGGVGAWVYAGAAIRVAQSMNLLRDNEFQIPNHIDRDMRRRVWWTLYDLERYQRKTRLIKLSLSKLLPSFHDCGRFSQYCSAN